MKKIKLVIWDLDETFWKGTLSEEGVVSIEQNITIVKELCDRGIMSSIVSKNDFDQAKEKLMELGVWDYFIFPTIAWESKGPLIKNLINDCQLRAENVLFVDDNHLNLEEAKFYNPALNVAEPIFLDGLLQHVSFVGKNDSSHSRLHQYKILEKKHLTSLKYSDNEAFLKDSNIRLQKIVGKDLLLHIDRITELIERTNQLNFTKIRSGKDDVISLINNEMFELSLIKVIDKFGDYGFVGFCALNKENHCLEHFVFSCRILNLGIPQYLYSLMGSPKIKIIPEVAEDLSKSKAPDWITEEPYGEKGSHSEKQDEQGSEKSIKVFFKGGCDLSQMLFYLQNSGVEIEEETNYAAANNFPIHQEHTQVLLDSRNLDENKKKTVLDKSYIPFVDYRYYSTRVFNPGYDCLVYSLLMDYTQELYLHRQSGIALPFGGYYLHWTDSRNEKDLQEAFRKKRIDLDSDVFSLFRQEFAHLGQISPENFVENLKKIRSLIPESVPIIFINGAELESPNIQEIAAGQRHKLMNAALDAYIRESENTYLLDVRNVIKDSSQLTDNLRHYNRTTYRMLAEELLKLLNKLFNENLKTSLAEIDVPSKKWNQRILAKGKQILKHVLLRK